MEQSDTNVCPECLEEIRVSEKRAIHGLLTTEKTNSAVGNLVKAQDFSDINRRISILTYVLKFF